MRPVKRKKTDTDEDTSDDDDDGPAKGRPRSPADDDDEDPSWRPKPVSHPLLRLVETNNPGSLYTRGRLDRDDKSH